MKVSLYRVQIFFLLVIAAILFCSAAFARVQVSVRIENPIDNEESKEIEYYLYSALHKSENLKEDAQKALADLERFESIDCKLVHDPKESLDCVLKRFRIIKGIRFEGVPLLVLEKELKKRVSIKASQVINYSDPKFVELIKRAENAILSYLDRQGYFHASVTTAYLERSGVPATDIVFKVQGGSYVRVRNVTLKSNTRIDPFLDTEIVTAPFKKMCANIRYSFEGIFQGTKACYNKDIEQETITSVEERLADLGYVEAHVTVKKNFIDAGEGPPSIADLEVTVRLGPKLLINFDFKDAQVLSIGSLVQFLRTISGVEFFSRAFNVPSPGGRFPEDETLLVSDLEDYLTFKSSHSTDDEEIEASIEGIQEGLRTRGYMNAKVDYVKDNYDNDRIKITFKIDPGLPTSISSLVLVGTKLFAMQELQQKLPLTIVPRSAFSSGHFSLENLKSDTEMVSDFFISQGYPKATVKTLLQEGNDGTDLVYEVELNEKKTIKQFVFRHDDQKLTETFLVSEKLCDRAEVSRQDKSTLIICAPFPYQETKLENIRLKLFDLYRKNGYLATEPLFSTSNDNSQLSVDFDFSGKEAKAKVAELLIDGNVETNRNVIERELGLRYVKSGNDFIPYKLEEGLTRLRSYGVFSRLTFEPSKLQTSENEYYLYLRLAEQPTFTGDLTLAFDSDYYFNVGFTLQERNLFGSLLQIKTELDFGLFIGRKSSFSNTFTWPRIFGLPMRLNFRVPELLYEILATELIPKRHAQLKTSAAIQWDFLKILHPKIEFQFRIDKWQVGDSTSDFRNFSFFKDPVGAITSLDGLIDVLKEPSSLRAILIPSLSAISIDNFIDPKFGYKLSAALHLSGAAFGNTIGFNVIDVEGTGYYTFGPITFAANLRFQRGFIKTPECNWWVLKYESDFATIGGAKGPRAYPKGQIGIKGVTLDGTGNAGLGPVYDKDFHPGNLLVQSALEMRFPIAKQFLFGRLDGAIFADLGFIGNCENDLFCFDRVRSNVLPCRDGQPPPPPPINPEEINFQLGSSIGLGLRFHLPVGPLTIDYAISPIHKVSQVTFQFGYPF